MKQPPYLGRWGRKIKVVFVQFGGDGLFAGNQGPFPFVLGGGGGRGLGGRGPDVATKS